MILTNFNDHLFWSHKGYWFYCWSAVYTLFVQLREHQEYVNRLAWA
jgi:hypothetical protein